MSQKSMAEACPFARSLDQPWKISKDEALAVDADDAQLRRQCRERVIRDLGPCSGDGGKEGRFAGIGETEEANVGDKLQPQPDPALLARLAGVGVARGAIG